MKVCFVSRLEGDETPWPVPMNDCRAWAYVFGGDTRHFSSVLADPEQLRAYDVVFFELTPNGYLVPPFVRSRVPGVALVGLVEGAVEAVSGQASWEQALFLECLASLDMLGVLVEDALPYYRLLASEPRRVQWIGVPYPKRWTDELEKPPAAAKERVVEVGAGLERGRNGLAALRLLERLRREQPALRGRVYGHPSELELVGRLAPGLEGALKRPWPEYYRHHLSAWAVLSLDPRRSWGRLVLDSASARIPYVGSNATHCADRVAVLTCDPYDVETAAAHLRRLLDDADLYEEVIEHQYAALAEFDEETSRARLAGALATAGLA